MQHIRRFEGSLGRKLCPDGDEGYFRQGKPDCWQALKRLA